MLSMPVVSSFPEFREAVLAGTAASLSVTFDADAELLARRALIESGMLLLGECHGVAENASIIVALAERLEIETVALEWPAELEPVVQRFVDGGELEDHPLLWLGDGRVTAEHAVVLRALARAGVGVRLIDRGFAPRRSWSERDRALADAALAATTGSERTLVVAGNAHTSRTETELGTPMGAWITQARPAARTIVIEYGSGSLFNFGLHALPDRFANEHRVCLRVENGDLQLRLPRATAATVLHNDTPPLAQPLRGETPLRQASH
jgi:hypothetical protein